MKETIWQVGKAKATHLKTKVKYSQIWQLRLKVDFLVITDGDFNC